MLRLVIVIVALLCLSGDGVRAQGAIALPQCFVPTDRPAVPVASTVAVNTQVLKASSGCLISARLTVGGAGAAGYFMLFNSTVVPADGTVTPLACVPIGAAPNAALVDFSSGPPAAFTVGISAAYSSTGCYTKTTPGTPVGFFNALIQ